MNNPLIIKTEMNSVQVMGFQTDLEKKMSTLASTLVLLSRFYQLVFLTFWTCTDILPSYYHNHIFGQVTDTSKIH